MSGATIYIRSASTAKTSDGECKLGFDSDNLLAFTEEI